LSSHISQALLRYARRKSRRREPDPLLIELFERRFAEFGVEAGDFPFAFSVCDVGGVPTYSISVLLSQDRLSSMREVVEEISLGLDPARVNPLDFSKLVQLLTEDAARCLARREMGVRVKELSELCAYEAIGLSRILALAKDQKVTEFYVDSDTSCVYLDHSEEGRCNTSIVLTERERKAVETHMDTFRGYTLDYANPSMKNDLEVSGARLRVSLDLAPASVNRFSLDVRRLEISSLSLEALVEWDVLSAEAAAFLVAWLEIGGNLTVVGETGTGKTTLLNALDEKLDPMLRRVYVEDAVETKDLIDRGYHQLKIKVDPFERSEGVLKRKETEVVKALHRSPDLVILSEIQSEEHSRAFFHALSAGVRGIQTFHASTIEQALRRWTSIHGVEKDNLLDLGVLVQMYRPERLRPRRLVARVTEVVEEEGEPRVRELYTRDREGKLRRVAKWEMVRPPEGRSSSDLQARVLAAAEGR